jgi:hypothetical protein
MYRNTSFSRHDHISTTVGRVALSLLMLTILVGCGGRKKDSDGKEPRVILKAEMRTGAFEIEINADGLESSPGRTLPMNTQCAATIEFGPRDAQGTQKGSYQFAWIRLAANDLTADTREEPPQPEAEAWLSPLTWDRREDMMLRAKRDVATVFRSLCERKLEFHIDSRGEVSIADANLPEDVARSLSDSLRPQLKGFEEMGPGGIRDFLARDQLLPDRPVGRGAVWHCSWERQWSQVMPQIQGETVECEYKLLSLNEHEATIAFNGGFRDKTPRTITWNGTTVSISSVVSTFRGTLTLNRDSNIIERVETHGDTTVKCSVPGGASQTSRTRADSIETIRRVDSRQ